MNSVPTKPEDNITRNIQVKKCVCWQKKKNEFTFREYVRRKKTHPIGGIIPKFPWYCGSSREYIDEEVSSLLLPAEAPSCLLSHQCRSSASPRPELAVSGLTPAPVSVTAGSLLLFQLWNGLNGEVWHPPHLWEPQSGEDLLPPSPLLRKT